MRICTQSIDVLCLGLSSRPERWRPTLARISRVLPRTRVVFGFGPDSPESKAFFSRPESRLTRIGEAGCLLGHAKIWKAVIDENLSEAIVIEDDVFPHRDFRQRLDGIEFPDDAAIVLLGSNWCGIPQRRPTGSPFGPAFRKHLGAFAYWLSKNTAEKALAGFKNGKVNIPVDKYISQSLKAEIAGIYVCNPALMIPDVSKSVIRGARSPNKLCERSGWWFGDYLQN